MWKQIKPVIGLAVLVIFGLLYGKYQDSVKGYSEQKNYSLLSFEYPNGISKLTNIKEVPATECDKIRTEYFKEAMDRCPECKVLVNKCSNSIPQQYNGVFRQEKISTPYIYKSYTNPEVIIPEGYSDGSFIKICEKAKSEFAGVYCIESN